MAPDTENFVHSKEWIRPRAGEQRQVLMCWPPPQPAAAHSAVHSRRTDRKTLTASRINGFSGDEAAFSGSSNGPFYADYSLLLQWWACEYGNICISCQSREWFTCSVSVFACRPLCVRIKLDLWRSRRDRLVQSKTLYCLMKNLKL